MEEKNNNKTIKKQKDSLSLNENKLSKVNKKNVASLKVGSKDAKKSVTTKKENKTKNKTTQNTSLKDIENNNSKRTSTKASDSILSNSLEAKPLRSNTSTPPTKVSKGAKGFSSKSFSTSTGSKSSLVSSKAKASSVSSGKSSPTPTSSSSNPSSSTSSSSSSKTSSSSSGSDKSKKVSSNQKNAQARNQSRMKKLEISNAGPIINNKKLKQELKDSMKKSTELKNAKPKAKSKSQALVKKLKKTNYRKNQKSVHTNQNKQTSNLATLSDNNSSSNVNHIEGVVKVSDGNLKSSSKNSDLKITGNVIGKKRDMKFITSKQLIIACVVLICITALSLLFSLGVYLVFKHKSENPQFTITKEAEIEILNSSSNLVSFTLPRKILPGSTLLQKTELIANNISFNQAVRVKGVFTSGDGEVFGIELELGDEWLKNEEDNYYYLTTSLKQGEKQTGTQKVMLPKIYDLDDKGQGLHVVSILYESLNFNKELVMQVWNTISQEILIQMFE